MEFGKAPYQSNVSLTNNILSYHFVHILFVSFLFHHQFFISCSSFSKYIHRELVVNNVFSPSCLPTFLLDWVDVNSNICVYTAMQVAKFLHMHLVAGVGTWIALVNLCSRWK